ncbi:hypothetical protein M0R45_026881 [Rubus argutus]|uniref:Uncharacterized protein n=1 Tax=Rubus argutus TaxID=59490 RepID=A0AAW1WYQ6_RUBAR
MALTLSFSLPMSATNMPVSSFKRLPTKIPTVKAVRVFSYKRIDRKRAIRIRPCWASDDSTTAVVDTTTTTVTRDDFPTGFIFGCVTSAHQVDMCIYIYRIFLQGLCTLKSLAAVVKLGIGCTAWGLVWARGEEQQ